MKNRLTVILGAGSTKNINFPTTESLTEKINNKLKLISLISKFFDNQLKIFNKTINFEDLIYLIKQLYFLFKTKNLVGNNNLYREKLEEILNIIGQEIILSKDNYEKQSNDYKWYEDFWLKLSTVYNLDIISFNYDNLFEKNIFKNNISNGFIDNILNSNDLLEFNKCSFYKRKCLDNNKKIKHAQHRIIRLHGSINFYSFDDLGCNEVEILKNKYKANEKFYNLYWKFDEKINKYISSSGNSESRSFIFSRKNKFYTSIITGHKKTEDFVPEPYKTYYSIIPKLFFKNSKTLIIGYGFNKNDSHLNKYIKTIKGNVYVVSYAEKDEEKKIINKIKSETSFDFSEESKTHKVIFTGFGSKIDINEIIKFLK